MYCKNCGTQIGEEERFCSKCGRSVPERRIDKNAVEQDKASPQSVQLTLPREQVQRWISLAVLLLVLGTPFYKLYSIPLVEAFSDLLPRAFRVEDSFSFFRWFKIINEIADEEGAKDDFMIAIAPAWIYFIFAALAAIAFLTLVSTVSKKYKDHSKDKYWRRMRFANICMTIANIELVVTKIVIFGLLGEEMLGEFRVDVSDDNLSLSSFIYILIIVSIANAVYSNNKIKNN